MINLARLAEQRKHQSAEKIEVRSLKQTHDVQLAEAFKPITKTLTQVLKKPDVEDRNTETPSIQNVAGTQSLLDTLTHMKKSVFFLKLVEKANGDVFWNGVHIKPLVRKRNTIMDTEYDIGSNIQEFFGRTFLTTKPMNNEVKLTVFNNLEKTSFYSKTQNILLDKLIVVLTTLVKNFCSKSKIIPLQVHQKIYLGTFFRFCFSQNDHQKR